MRRQYRLIGTKITRQIDNNTNEEGKYIKLLIVKIFNSKKDAISYAKEENMVNITIDSRPYSNKFWIKKVPTRDLYLDKLLDQLVRFRNLANEEI